MPLPKDLYKGRRVYLSGDVDATNAARAFERAERLAKDAGADYVCNPYRHLSMYARRTEAQKLRWRLHQLTTGELAVRGGSDYQVLLLLNDWNDCKACWHEVNIAKLCGIEVQELSVLEGLCSVGA